MPEIFNFKWYSIYFFNTTYLFFREYLKITIISIYLICKEMFFDAIFLETF